MPLTGLAGRLLMLVLMTATSTRQKMTAQHEANDYRHGHTIANAKSWQDNDQQHRQSTADYHGKSVFHMKFLMV